MFHCQNTLLIGEFDILINNTCTRTHYVTLVRTTVLLDVCMLYSNYVLIVVYSLRKKLKVTSDYITLHALPMILTSNVFMSRFVKNEASSV